MDDVPYFQVKPTVACNLTLVKFADATRLHVEKVRGVGNPKTQVQRPNLGHPPCCLDL